LPPLIFFAKGKKPNAGLAAKSKQNYSQNRCATFKIVMRRIIYIFIFLFLCTFFGCNSDDNPFDTEVLFYWNQTKCADPWNTGQNDSNEETEIAVKAYLIDENVRINKLNFDANSPLDVFCESCGCGTGQRILVEVSKSDVSKMKQLGFYQ
ncbi:MAG: hypothetical protein WBN59_06580, partial [Flavobacteriaceae bacterium]